MAANSSDQLFVKALRLGTLLAVAVAALGSLIGYFVAGMPGVYAALVGATVSVIFGSMTTLSIWLGGKLPLNGFYGMVLGGWLLKILVFAAILFVLQGATNFSGPVFFFAVVASVLGNLAIDSWLVLTGKIPTVGK